MKLLDRLRGSKSKSKKSQQTTAPANTNNNNNNTDVQVIPLETFMNNATTQQQQQQQQQQLPPVIGMYSSGNAHTYTNYDDNDNNNSGDLLASADIRRRNLQTDDASLFNAASSMGDDTRGHGDTATLSPSVNSILTYNTYNTLESTTNTNMDDDAYACYGGHNTNDNATCVSSVYQRSVLSASASVYTTSPSLFTNVATDAADVDVDSLRELHYSANNDVVSDDNDDADMNMNMNSQPPTASASASASEKSDANTNHLVSNEKLDDIRRHCTKTGNTTSNGAAITTTGGERGEREAARRPNTNNNTDGNGNDGPSATALTNDNHNNNNSENSNNVNVNANLPPPRFNSGGIDVDGDDMDDDEPGTLRLTVDGLQQHDRKEAMKADQHIYGSSNNNNNGVAIAPFPGMGVLYPVGEMRNAGPIDVDEGVGTGVGVLQQVDDECIARKMMTLKLERQEELSKRQQKEKQQSFNVGVVGGLGGSSSAGGGGGSETQLDRIDEDEMSVLSTKPFSAGTGVSPKKTQELLRREREKEREDRLRKAMIEAKERKRAQKLREAELIRQRNMQNEVQLRKEREAQAHRRMRRGDSDNNSRSTVGSNGYSNPESNAEVVNGTNFGGSKGKSTDVPSYCVVCMEGERSHLAVPCMHFSFCEYCVKDMHSRNVRKCPVCNEDNITFSKVFF